jgi:hypothetical protein
MRADSEKVAEIHLENSTLSGSHALVRFRSRGVAAGYRICSLRERVKRLFEQSHRTNEDH